MTMMFCPATVTVAERAAAPELAAAVKATEPGPVPEGGMTVSQAALLVPIQLQPEPAAPTAMLPEPPPTAT